MFRTCNLQCCQLDFLAEKYADYMSDHGEFLNHTFEEYLIITLSKREVKEGYIERDLNSDPSGEPCYKASICSGGNLLSEEIFYSREQAEMHLSNLNIEEF